MRGEGRGDEDEVEDRSDVTGGMTGAGESGGLGSASVAPVDGTGGGRVGEVRGVVSRADSFCSAPLSSVLGGGRK